MCLNAKQFHHDHHHHRHHHNDHPHHIHLQVTEASIDSGSSVWVFANMFDHPLTTTTWGRTARENFLMMMMMIILNIMLMMITIIIWTWCHRYLPPWQEEPSPPQTPQRSSRADVRNCKSQPISWEESYHVPKIVLIEQKLWTLDLKHARGCPDIWTGVRGRGMCWPWKHHIWGCFEVLAALGPFAF